jgi:NhaC family Na+:H+ antiporter
MAERITLTLFGATLALFLLLNFPLVIALVLGLVYFCCYALYCGHSPRQILLLIAQGLNSAKTILAIFAIVGTLTALWRASGVIPYLITCTVPLIPPALFLPCVFLLCCAMSFLTGSSFGSVSTMGVICMTIGRATALPVPLLAGAILSGVFFGDRCSPISSSALLVCQLTGTEIYHNLKGMVRTSLVPFSASLFLYTLLGARGGGAGLDTGTLEIFTRQFQFTPWLLIPAGLILILSLLRCNILVTMTSSALAAAVLAALVQDLGLGELISTALVGYRSPNPQLAQLLDGGGVLSMVSTGAVVALSSSYFGIFRATHLLDSLKNGARRLADAATPFISAAVASLATASLSCNQTLSSMLTCEIIAPLYEEREELALALENSVILLSALIPWSIACSFPLAVLGAPDWGLVWACYLYLVPLWNLLVSLRAKHRRNSIQVCHP